jgi:phage terminase small subunit
VSRARNPQRKVSPEAYRPKQRKQFPDQELIRTNGETYLKQNPHGANAHVKDPRQDIMWEHFLPRWMKGAGNAAESARYAGYSETTAANVTNLFWYKEKFQKLKRKEMLSKAERNLDKVLDIDYNKLTELGEEKIDVDLLKAVIDVSKIVATTLGKDEGYSTKSEIAKNVSGTVNIKAINYADQVIEAPKPADVIDVQAQEFLDDGQE